MGCLYSKGNVRFITNDKIYNIKERGKQQQEEKKEKKPSTSSSAKVDYTQPSKLEPSPQHLSKKAPNARKIQAWWRGTLVRRSLLRAALSAWIIQCWWRKTLAKRHEKNRLMILYLMAQETRACVIIQSWVRMLKIRQYYSRLCYATHVIQTSWRWHKCHTRGFFQGSYELVGHKLRLQLDIFLGSWVCRISDCISLPIKN
ncbi:IQ domain-containing protein F5-like isoform X2 [Mastomys coucha]|uniref:IQ domain-containing protein F5-like isoform X2 n=1 Tax=Mastomys coucha TaxID=35658 RepID=UPI001261E24B|nr:IQ domain-containing protein F5-like isoform X2 [Mastomys coucha]